MADEKTPPKDDLATDLEKEADRLGPTLTIPNSKADPKAAELAELFLKKPEE